MMTKQEMRAFRDMSAEAYRLHDCGVNGNVTLTSILAGGLLLMAVAGSIAGREPYVAASNGLTRPQDEPAF